MIILVLKICLTPRVDLCYASFPWVSYKQIVYQCSDWHCALWWYMVYCFTNYCSTGRKKIWTACSWTFFFFLFCYIEKVHYLLILCLVLLFLDTKLNFKNNKWVSKQSQSCPPPTCCLRPHFRETSSEIFHSWWKVFFCNRTSASILILCTKCIPGKTDIG